MSAALVCGRCGALGPGPMILADASTQTDASAPDCSSGFILALQQELALAQSRLQLAMATRRQMMTAATQTAALDAAGRGHAGLLQQVGPGPGATPPPWDQPMYLQGPRAAPFPPPLSETSGVAANLHLPGTALQADEDSADSDSRDGGGETEQQPDRKSPQLWGMPAPVPAGHRVPDVQQEFVGSRNAVLEEDLSQNQQLIGCGDVPRPQLVPAPPSPSAPQRDWGPYSEQVKAEPDIDTWRLQALSNATDTVSGEMASEEGKDPEPQETPASSTSSRAKRPAAATTKGRARRKPGRRIHPCPDCGKTFPSQKDVRRHRFSHTGEKPHACTWCGKAFALASNLRSHERAVHAGERPHACQQCDKAFSASKDLRLHILTHTGERPHACNRCGQRFTQLGNLRTHERVVHLKERPHVCDTCGRGFAKLASFRAHVRSHTGERPHVCEECGRAFGRSELLSLHRRTHTGEKPYSCTECGRAFSQLATLTQHKRTHTGERPFTCVSCGSAFARKSSLTQHMRTHTGERPFCCEHCGRAFSRSSRLTEHRRTAHASPQPPPPPPM